MATRKRTPQRRTRLANGMDPIVAPAPAGHTWCSLCRCYQHPRWHQPEWRRDPARTPEDVASYSLAPIGT